MLSYSKITRSAKCQGRWYPLSRTKHNFEDTSYARSVISPHAGFQYSGNTALKAVSSLKKERIWIFGPSHFENITNGISIYPGEYNTSIGRAVFPDLSNEDEKILYKYYSDQGHRKNEHSIENVLYAINHFKESPYAFCILVNSYDTGKLESIADDIAGLWKNNDSIVISTDWNHFKKTNEIGKLMKEVAILLEKGDIEKLYKLCEEDKYEACGIDSLYLAHLILKKVGLISTYRITEITDSSKAEKSFTELCVGYIAAELNNIH